MDPLLKNKFDGRFGRAVVLKDPKGFLRPDDLTGGRPPAEAPRMTEPLAFHQVRVISLLGTPTRDQNAGVFCRATDRSISSSSPFVVTSHLQYLPLRVGAPDLGKSSVTGHGSIIVAKKRESEAVGSIDPHVVKQSNASTTRSRTSSGVSKMGIVLEKSRKIVQAGSSKASTRNPN
jgi:hypothetical protein